VEPLLVRLVPAKQVVSAALTVGAFLKLGARNGQLVKILPLPTTSLWIKRVRMKASLSEFSMSELMELARRAKDKVVVVKTDTPFLRVIFEGGEPVFAIYRNLKGERLFWRLCSLMMVKWR